jgi:Ohr subfamily peroxiredoxin
MPVLYTASATATGEGRNGHVRSSDGLLDFDLAVPTEMGGPGGALTNPEQLFAAGYAACFGSAVEVVGRRMKEDVSDAKVTAHVGIGATGDGGFGLEVELHVDLPHADDAEAVVNKAHEVCPYSNATRGNIEVKLVVGAAA